MKKSLLILCIVIVCIASAVYFEVTLIYGFLAAILLVLPLVKDKGKSIFFGIQEVVKCSSIFTIILLLGANIALWMSSGILPSLVYYASGFIANINFLLITFLITALVSIVMGTGLGTFSTIGIVFLTLSKPLGYPTAVVVGCIVSGAFVADKISPVAALVNLTIKITNTTYKTYIRSALKTLLPTLMITAILYAILNGQFVSDVPISLDIFTDLLPVWFKISWLTLCIPLAMIVLSFVGIKVVHNMLSVFIASSLLTLFYQNFSLAFWLKTITKGFSMTASHLDKGDEVLIDIFKGGGMFPMVEVLIIVAGAVFLTGLLMSEKVLDPLINLLMKHTHSPFQLVLKTGILSTFLTTLTCDQTVGITVPGEVLQDNYKKMGLSPDDLARTISDTGTIVAPLEFWNVNALIITGLSGVSAIQYAPYALLCFISPLMTLVYALVVLDKKIKKL